MKISLYTQILPRLETFFLDEWIEYHKNLGIDKFYIYDSVSVDSDGIDFNKWEKKPHLDYFEDYTDAQIYKELYKIVDKHNESVELIKWQPNCECILDSRQNVKHMDINIAFSNNESDWWLHIDPDEYLYSKNKLNLKDFLKTNEDVNNYSISFNQRVFEARQRNKRVADINIYGYDIDIRKTIVKNPYTGEKEKSWQPKIDEKWIDEEHWVRHMFIHDLESKHDLGQNRDFLRRLEKNKINPDKVTDFNDFRINHYRGYPYEENSMHTRFVESMQIKKFNKTDF